MELSIIIPVFNTDIFSFKRCIQSIINSDDFANRKYEIILVDDGSLDINSIEYKKYVKKNDKIRYYKKVNGGVSSARNYGISVSKGKYILFVDSDDIVISNNINWKKLDKNYDIVFYDMSIIKNEKILNNYKDTNITSSKEVNYVDILKEFVLYSKFYSPCAKFIKRDFILSNSIKFNCEMINGEDAMFNLDLLLKHPSIFYISKSIYGYYYLEDHYENRILNKFDTIIQNYLYKYNVKKEIIRDYDFDESYLKKIENSAIDKLFSISMISMNNKKNKLSDIAKYMETFAIDYNYLSLINKFKYLILKHKFGLIVKLFSIVRKIKFKNKR